MQRGKLPSFSLSVDGGEGSGEITLPPPSAGEKFGKFLGESPAQLKKKNTDSMLFVILKFGGGVEKRLI